MARQQSEAERAYEAGKVAVEEERWLDALVELWHAVKVETDMAAAYPLLLQAAMALKNDALAARIIEMAAEHAPEAIHAMEPYMAGLSARGRRSRLAPSSLRDPACTVYQLKITLISSKLPSGGACW